MNFVTTSHVAILTAGLIVGFSIGFFFAWRWRRRLRELLIEYQRYKRMEREKSALIDELQKRNAALSQLEFRVPQLEARLQDAGESSRRTLRTEQELKALAFSFDTSAGKGRVGHYQFSERDLITLLKQVQKGKTEPPLRIVT